MSTGRTQQYPHHIMYNLYTWGVLNVYKFYDLTPEEIKIVEVKNEYG